MALPLATGQLHKLGWKKVRVVTCLQAQSTHPFMGMILPFRDNKHSQDFPNFRVWEEIPGFLLKAKKTEGLYPFGSGDSREITGVGSIHRVWPGCLTLASLEINKGRSVGKRPRKGIKKLAMSLLCSSHWLCGVMSVWIRLALISPHFVSLAWTYLP